MLITGASRGIGRAAALCFAAQGCRVAANYRSAHREMEMLCAEIKQLGGVCLPLCADVGDPEAAAQMVQEAEASFGHLDILVNNAGIALQKLTQDTTPEEWRQLFAVNVDAAFYTVRAALPGMIRRHSGRIINVSSIWGVSGASCEAAYSASKAALIGFTKALAQEVGPSGITVNCVAPGVIQTDMNRALSAETLNALREETPLGRLGTPEDVAQSIAFLASEEAGFLTGQVLGVDGGIIL